MSNAGNRLTGYIGWLLTKIEAVMTTMFDWLVHGRTTFVSPRTVVHRAIREADKNSVNWGMGDVEYPNSFEVMLDPASWDSYYGSVVHASEKRIADALSAHFSKVGGHFGRLEVMIAVDPSLGRGRVRVSAGFDERAGECRDTPPLVVDTLDAVVRARRPKDVMAQRSASPVQGSRAVGLDHPFPSAEGDGVFDGVPEVYYGMTPPLVVSKMDNTQA